MSVAKLNHKVEVMNPSDLFDAVGHQLDVLLKSEDGCNFIKEIKKNLPFKSEQ